MRNLLIIILLAAGGYQLYSKFYMHGPSAFDDNGNPRTLIFTINGCKPCTDASHHLKTRKIAFEEINVSEGEDQMNAAKEFGVRQYPFIISGNLHTTGFYESDLTGMLATVYGPGVLSIKEKKLMQDNFNADGTAKTIMYSTQTCGYCVKARELFNAEGVDFVELDIKKSAGAKRKFDALKGSGTPLIFIGYHRINGYNKNKILDTLKSQKI
jgi:glutaredoxin